MAEPLNVGVLGCGPIAQAAHLEGVVKAANTRLHAVCDVAEDLARRMAITHGADRVYLDYDEMLADPDIDMVIVATSDAFHVDASKRALQAGKHVLCEKPLGMSVEEVEDLARVAAGSGRLLQVGHMKRFDAGIQSARAFVADEMGDMLALKAWYCDGTRRYDVTNAVQPVILRSTHARKPAADPKADLRQYYALAHGSHLVDTARYLAGPITEVDARFRQLGKAHCWFIDVAFESGALGHLDLTVPICLDWSEGFQVYGQNGTVQARTYNPWLYKSSDVEIFREATGETTRVLGADGHFYRRQIEALALAAQTGAAVPGADAADGIASIRALVAIRESVDSGRPVRLDAVSGAV